MKVTPQDVSSKITQCRICQSKDIEEVINLGMQPIANNFLDWPSQEEPKFPLGVTFCNACTTAQSSVDIPKDLIFQRYLYKSSFSTVFDEHFKEVAHMIKNKYHPKTLIEVGCNDGIFLKYADKFCEAYGIDPASNIIQSLRKNTDLKVTSGYVEDPYIYGRALRTVGKADVIYGANVFAHISDMMTALNHVRLMLKNDGVFVFEVQYLESLVKNKNFDMIYHEHYFYWSKESVTIALGLAGFDVVEIEDIETHGGSIRVHAKKSVPFDESYVPMALDEEGVDKLSLISLMDDVENIKTTIQPLLNEIKSNNGTVIGYGAPAKGNTMLNYFDIDNSYIDYIIDDSELKQNKYTPGTHIPILRFPDIVEADFVLILAWNYAEPIMQKFKDRNIETKFILPFPEPKIL